MTENNLLEKLSRAPADPGVYLMKDNAGKIIYVGKAKNLKKRLSSYFLNKHHTDVKTLILLGKICDFDTVITKTEQEALILESNLIKRHKPQYNVILKDDKRYPLIRINMKSTYPYLERVRKIENDGNLYFGPFASSTAVNDTIKVIQKTFKLRKCRSPQVKERKRPCLNYQMGSCLAPCVFDIPKETYFDIVKEVSLFLKGRTPDLIRKIREEMMAASENQEFEKAAALRDKLFAIQKVTEKQIVVSKDLTDRDMIAVSKREGMSLLTILIIRNGYWISTRHYEINESLSSEKEIIGTFINQYYGDKVFIPKEICVQDAPEETDLYQDHLSGIKGQKVHIFRPIRGEKAHLLGLAVQNADKELDDRIAAGKDLKHKMVRLQQKLHLEKLPEKIECFDNSNISGKEPVAGMVVFVNGRPEKKLYRKFKIKDVPEQDDYAYMREVLTRRFQHTEESWAYPDILLVDGGKGQLNIAVAVLREMGLHNDIPMVGIAKKDEEKGETEDKIFVPGRSNPISFGKDKDLLFLFEQIRDEAHRFAISFHRKRRAKSAIRSVWDDIEGVGTKRKKMLLATYETIDRIKKASVEELAGLPGMNLRVAVNIKKHFDSLS